MVELTGGMEKDATRIAQLEEEAREATEKVPFSSARVMSVIMKEKLTDLCGN